ncbi:unnamed protein product, partial [Nippostrongylus brasiliensis]|uniref:DUF4097 domain-containing protein n=1 Tax=Nippostrongylus brasiliensis TaxID=27835 RepID=A0A0N4YY65_NIPBR
PQDYDEFEEFIEVWTQNKPLLIGGAALAGVTLLCLLYCMCCRGGSSGTQKTAKPTAGSATKKTKTKDKDKKKKVSGSSGSTASVSAPVAEPKKMEGEKINLMEFAEKGRLVMRDARGEVKHVLDDDISGEIQRVQYDSGQNEIVQIGSGIEIIESSRSEVQTEENKTQVGSTERAKQQEKDGVKSVIKSAMNRPKTKKKKGHKVGHSLMLIICYQLKPKFNTPNV